MSAKSVDVFSLRDTVVGEYRKFATSFTTIHAEDIRQQVEAIYAEETYEGAAAAARTGRPYQTRLDPPPCDPRVAHPDTRPAAEKKGAP